MLTAFCYMSNLNNISDSKRDELTVRDEIRNTQISTASRAQYAHRTRPASGPTRHARTTKYLACLN
jgi:hypothetical protein